MVVVDGKAIICGPDARSPILRGSDSGYDRKIGRMLDTEDRSWLKSLPPGCGKRLPDRDIQPKIRGTVYQTAAEGHRTEYLLHDDHAGCGWI